MDNQGWERRATVIRLVIAALAMAGLPGLAVEGIPSGIAQDSNELSPVARTHAEVGEARKPVPDNANFGQAMKMIAEAFPVSEKANGEQAKERIDALLAACQKTAIPARQYAFLLTAESAAIATGNVRKAIEIADARTKTFQVNPLDARIDVITSSFTPLTKNDPKLLEQLYDLAFETADCAVRAKEWQKAGAAARLAGSIANATRNAGKILHLEDVTACGDDRLKQVADFEKALANHVRVYEAYVDGTKVLGQAADDPNANEAVGRYLCFVCDDWSKGLPLLAKAADATLKELAIYELKHPEGQRTATTAFDIAGRWWGVASEAKLDHQEKASIEQHAGCLYGECFGKLSDPLDQAIAEKRAAGFRKSDKHNRANRVQFDNAGVAPAPALPAGGGSPEVESKREKGSLSAEIQWCEVGDPNNAPDANGLGSVPHRFRMMKYEWTVRQYVDFLNAVDPDGMNPEKVYHEHMQAVFFSTDEAKGKKYAITTNMANRPIAYVNWWNAAMVCNWLHHGGKKYGTTQEAAAALSSGVYDVRERNGAASAKAMLRDPKARIWIPSLNEWYKAAYYKGKGNRAGYWVYPTQSDAKPNRTLADHSGSGVVGGDGNFANYGSMAKWRQDGRPYFCITNVGTNGGPGPYGTFDMAGNIAEWCGEWPQFLNGNHRCKLGGCYRSQSDAADLSKDRVESLKLNGHFQNGSDPNVRGDDYGFRLAAPASP